MPLYCTRENKPQARRKSEEERRRIGIRATVSASENAFAAAAARRSVFSRRPARRREDKDVEDVGGIGTGTSEAR